MRYQVKEHPCKAYYVEDTEGKKYGMPEMAVTLYFKTPIQCAKVVDILNLEWMRFLANPS